MKTKICSKCGMEKSTEKFAVYRRSKGGLSCWCKSCKMDHYYENREAILAKNRLNHKNNPEKKRRASAEYRKNHTLDTEYYRSYRNKNREKLNDYLVSWGNRKAKYRSFAAKLTVDDKPTLCVDGIHLEVECKYCKNMFQPTNKQAKGRIRRLSGEKKGESNFYCSDSCKDACSTYGRVIHRKGEVTSAEGRSHQAELRYILIEERGLVCEKCGAETYEANLICHHILPVKTDPLESLDKDNCILICKECNEKVHQKEGCKTWQLAKLVC